MCPQIELRDELLTLANLLPSGTQNLGEPSANEGGKNWGWRGRSPIPGGLGDVPPKLKARGKLPTLNNRHRVGLKTLADP